MLMCIQNLVKFCPLVLKILSGNEILTSIKGHNSVANLRKMTLSLRKHPHMFYTPSFDFLYSRKGEIRGNQNEGLFSGLD